MASFINNLQDDNNIPLADDDPQGEYKVAGGGWGVGFSGALISAAKEAFIVVVIVVVGVIVVIVVLHK